jgi:hypothetical protein
MRAVVRGSAVVASWLVLGGSATAATTATTTYASPGAYSFTVPAGVGHLSVTAIGAAGGAGCNGAAGGKGAVVTDGNLIVGPGTVLSVEVGGVGGSGQCGADAFGGAGGIGGGGRGGVGQFGGGGGGGASVVSDAEPLLVAAGGGGSGATTIGLGGGAGGDAGSAGADGAAAGSGGGAGTQSAGGAGGTGAPSHGLAGAFLLGGHAGGSTNSNAGGGGGGGGIFGGGGGAGDDAAAAGSGGGGYSYVIGGQFSPGTPTAQPAEVTITYNAPTADLSASAAKFATQPQGLASSEQVITVTNNGSAPLVVTGYVVAGADPGDFLISNRCGEAHVGGSCQIGVRFDPQATGARSATLTLVTNAATAPATITLSGVGGPLPQGPQGKQGPPGPAGKIELVTCKTVIKRVKRGHRFVKKHVQRCKARLVTGRVKFVTRVSHARVVLARSGVVYAVGSAVRLNDGRWRLSLSDRRSLQPGRYALTLRTPDGRVLRRLAIRIR